MSTHRRARPRAPHPAPAAGLRGAVAAFGLGAASLAAPCAMGGLLGSAVPSPALASGCVSGASEAEGPSATGTGAVACGPGARATGDGSVALGQGSVADKAFTVSVGAPASDDGSAPVTRRITNVGDGTDASDAVTVGQLNGVGTGAAAAIGGGASYGGGTFTGPSYSLNGSSTPYTDVVSGLQALASGQAGPAQYVAPGAASNALLLVGAGAMTLGNVAAGVDPGDAVNVAQLAALKGQIAALQAGPAGPAGAPAPVQTTPNDGSSAAGGGAMAAGAGARASGDAATALGANSRATGSNSTALGANNAVSGAGSTAVGAGNAVAGARSGAFGAGNTVVGDGSYALGDPNLVVGNNAVVVGDDNAVNGPGVAGNGDDVNVLGSRNAVAGAASAAGAAVLGNDSRVDAVGAVAVGNGVVVTGAGAVAVGQGSSATLPGAVALGAGAITAGASSVANNAAAGVGYNAGAVAAGSGSVVSVGAPGAERQIRNVAAGAVTQTSTDAVNGSQLFAVARDATALGAATAGAIGGGTTYSPAAGLAGPRYRLNGSDVTYTDVVSGQQALASGGAGPVQYAVPGMPSNAVNLVGAGGRVTLGNVAPGAVDAASAQAVNGAQLYGASRSVASALGGGAAVGRDGAVSAPAYQIGSNTYGDVGSALGALQSDMQTGLAGLQNSLADLQGRVDQNYRRANGGIAAAIAGAGLRYDDRPGKVSTGAALSGWNGAFGLAGGVGATSLDGQWRINAAFALSPSAGGHTDVGAVGGVTYTWN